MDGESFHKQKKKEVLELCKELKTAYGSDWIFVMPVLFPDSFSYLKLINKIKQNKKYGKWTKRF